MSARGSFLALLWMMVLAPPAVAAPDRVASSDGVNLARAARVRQSSVGWGGEAERAVDGQVDGDYRHGSVSHTLPRRGSWLELDLGEAVVVARVVVHNRTDCCGENLDGVRVELSLDPCDAGERRVVGAEVLPVGGLPRMALVFGPPRRARYVCLRQDTHAPLSVAEVEVMGAS